MPRLDVARPLHAMREGRPLVHHITNQVTIGECAQVTRRFGCLPVMAHAAEEVEEMVGLASALVLNIGTLTPATVEAMLLAARAANRRGIPVVLDPVGAGATRFRTESARRLLGEARVDVLKGNAGEIATLAGVEAEVRGVESISAGGDPGAVALSLARSLRCVVAVTGAECFVSEGERVWTVRYGHALMGRVVGTGCTSTSAVGCFAAVGKGDLLSATAAALACYGYAGERAVRAAGGPGGYFAALFDAVEDMAQNPEGLSLEAGEIR